MKDEHLAEKNSQKLINLRGKIGTIAAISIIGVFLIAIAPFVTGYVQSMIVKILIYGIFAVSLNLLWGYTGLFSLGHAAYFGVGGYVAGILAVRYGVHSFWILAPAGILSAGMVAAIFAFPALRVRGSYFLLVTLALGELLFSVAIKWRAVTGGSNGLAGIPYPDLNLPGITINSTSFYYLVLVGFAICLFVIYRIVKSPFGLSLRGIRGNPRRMSALGHHVFINKYLVFVIAGLFAGAAGVLFGPFSRIMAPPHLGIMTSTLVMLMVIIGSESLVFGPVTGAAIVVLLEHFASIYIPERWPLILGGIFIISVMFLPGGVSIYLSKLWNKVFSRDIGVGS